MARLHLRSKEAADPTPKKYLNRDMKRHNVSLKRQRLVLAVILLASICINILKFNNFI